MTCIRACGSVVLPAGSCDAAGADAEADVAWPRGAVQAATASGVTATKMRVTRSSRIVRDRPAVERDRAVRTPCKIETACNAPSARRMARARRPGHAGAARRPREAAGGCRDGGETNRASPPRPIARTAESATREEIGRTTTVPALARARGTRPMPPRPRVRRADVRSGSRMTGSRMTGSRMLGTSSRRARARPARTGADRRLGRGANRRGPALGPTVRAEHEDRLGPATDRAGRAVRGPAGVGVSVSRPSAAPPRAASPG